MWPQNLVYLMEPVDAVRRIKNAWDVCWFQNPWWEKNAKKPVPDMVPCPEWLHNDSKHEHSDEEIARWQVYNRHWCFEVKDETEEGEGEIEDAGDFLLSNIKLTHDRGDNLNHVEELEEHSFRSLGHKWNWEWMTQWFKEKLWIEEQVKLWHWEEFNDKVDAVRDGSMAYWETEQDRIDDKFDKLDEMRDRFGEFDYWERTWDIAESILGIQYSYQQGYYWFYLGRYTGMLAADIAIVFQWYFLYEALQPWKALAFNDYYEAYAEDWEDNRMMREILWMT